MTVARACRPPLQAFCGRLAGRWWIAQYPPRARKSTNRRRYGNTLRIMLTSKERRVLDFERFWWTLPGPKDRDISEVLGLDSGDYYRVLREMLNKPAALAYDPLTVRRLRKVLERARNSLPRPAGVSGSVE